MKAPPAATEPRCRVRGINLRRRLPILAAVLMLVLAVGCFNNNANKRIAFTSDRDGDNEIFVMDADGSHVVATGQRGFDFSRSSPTCGLVCRRADRRSWESSDAGSSAVASSPSLLQLMTYSAPS